MILTIAIPTYNRVSQLKQTLARLLPQVTTECCVLILDNCSGLIISEEIKDVLINYPKVQLSVQRNKINIGGDSNIMRCFELCDTKWLWTLGDDDEITPNAVQIILQDAQQYSDCTHINYYSPHNLHPVRNDELISHGRNEYVKNIDSFGASIFMSSNIYNTQKLRKHWLANNNTYSCVSQWLIVYYSLENSDYTIRSNKVICHNTYVSTAYSNANLTISRGFATLIDLQTNKDEKKEIINCLRKSSSWITFESVYKCYLVDYMRSGKTLDVRFLFHRIYTSLYKYYGLSHRIKFCIYYGLLLASPTFAFKVLRKVIFKQRRIDIADYL